MLLPETGAQMGGCETHCLTAAEASAAMCQCLYSGRLTSVLHLRAGGSDPADHCLSSAP